MEGRIDRNGGNTLDVCSVTETGGGSHPVVVVDAFDSFVVIVNDFPSGQRHFVYLKSIPETFSRHCLKYGKAFNGPALFRIGLSFERPAWEDLQKCSMQI